MNPPVGLGLGHLKLNGMKFLKGIGLQIYQYEEHFVLNQRQHTGLPVIRYTLAHFAFQSKMAVIFIPMVLKVISKASNSTGVNPVAASTWL